MATRANQRLTLVASATLTAAPTIADQINDYDYGLHLIVDVTSINAGTPSITVTIKGKDPASGKYYTILASAAITTVTTNVYKVCPGLTASANAVANDLLPATWTVVVTHADGQAITYSIGALVVKK